jgi:hypothetical protein
MLQLWVITERPLWLLLLLLLLVLPVMQVVSTTDRTLV